LRADVFVETGDAVGVVRRVRHIIGNTADHVLHLPQNVSLTAFETLGYAWCWSSDLMSKELLMPVQEIKCDRRVTVSTSPLPAAVGKAGSDTRTAMQRLEAHEDGAYRGHVHLVATRFATASLAQLVVEPPHRGRGIGGLLLRAAEAQARASGSVRMVLHPSAAAREINFYGRNGYALAGQVRLLLSGSSTPTGSRSRLARSE
jgi:GNAT superfamily N-acetyltransferase